MAESDIFVSNDIALDVDFGEIFVVDQGVVYKVIAEKYSSEKTYAVGDYVSHLEKLYKCITAVETAEAFDEEKWTEVFLADEVQIANNNIALKANAADLATVATSGSYDDLTDKPTIPAAQVNSDWNAASGVAQILNKPNLATVATSGSYNDLTGKPEIPAAQVQADYGQTDNTKIDYIKNKPNLATVATSGNYTDLTNKPIIPAAQVNSDWEANSGVAQILNKPTIPTVNDAIITVVQGSTTKGTFTLNQSADATITLDAGGGGGGAQVALTQAEYDALVQAGTVDPTVEYFITDGIPYTQSFIQGDLTVETSLGWQLRQKYFVKSGICFIDIILGTDQNGFSEDEKIYSGAPIPQGMVTASLIGLCDGSFYRFYIDDEGDVYCRYPISAQYKEVIIFGSYPTNQ